MHANSVALSWWLFLVVLITLVLASTTDLHASDINTTEIAKCMIAKSPYAGSFDRWDYLDYCGGSDMWRMEIQCKIDELTGMNSSADIFTDVSCKCSPGDNGGGMYDDDDSSERLC